MQALKRVRSCGKQPSKSCDALLFSVQCLSSAPASSLARMVKLGDNTQGSWGSMHRGDVMSRSITGAKGKQQHTPLSIRDLV